MEAVAERMKARKVGFLPVCDETGAVVGTVTDRDLAVRVLAEHRSVAATRVHDVMTPTGTITFGDIAPPPPATDPNQPYPPAPTMRQDPMSGGLLELNFVPSELWRGWRAIQTPATQSKFMSDVPGNAAVSFDPCACDGGACASPSSPVRRATLMVSGSSMQGQLLLQGAGALIGSTDLRLQRVQ